MPAGEGVFLGAGLHQPSFLGWGLTGTGRVTWAPGLNQRWSLMAVLAPASWLAWLPRCSYFYLQNASLSFQHWPPGLCCTVCVPCAPKSLPSRPTRPSFTICFLQESSPDSNPS